MDAICKDQNCLFKFLATKPYGIDAGIIVKKHCFEHTCEEFVFANEKRSTIPSSIYLTESRSFLSATSKSSIKGLLISFIIPSNIWCLDLQRHIQNGQKNPPKYFQAAKVKAMSMQDAFGDTMEQYQKLDGLKDAILLVDSVATVSLEKDEQNIFIRFFWSYGASRNFISLQRPLLCFDAGWTKSHPKGNLMCMASEDMESRQVILAIMWTREEESISEWTIFLRNCYMHIPVMNSEYVGLISD